MKRLLLILLCVPLLFSCGEKDDKKNKDKEDLLIENIEEEVEEYEPQDGRWEDYYNLIDEGYSHEEADELLMSEYSDIDPNESEDYYDQSEGNVSSLAIGDMHQGGIIFWVDNTGQHGLVCDLQDLGEAEWGCSGTSISGANGKSIGTGQQNTSAILSLCPQSGIAAEMCYNSTAQGYSDWFLPSLDELYQMQLSIEAINATFVSNGRDDLRSRYWSSSQHNDPKYQNDYLVSVDATSCASLFDLSWAATRGTHTHTEPHPIPTGDSIYRVFPFTYLAMA